MVKLQPSRLMSFSPLIPEHRARRSPAALISSAKILFPSWSDSKPLHPFVGSTYSLWELLVSKSVKLAATTYICGPLRINEEERGYL